jgi:hypothetical protein
MSRALASNSSALAKVKVRRAGMIWERIFNIPGFPSDCFGNLGGKALDVFDGQRQNVEVAGPVHLAPSAQELAGFAKSRLRQRRDDVPIGSHIT